MTNPKPLTDKPDHKQEVKTSRQAGSMFPTPPDRTDCFGGLGSKIRDPESGSISHYINSITCDFPFISQFKDDRNTARASDRSNEVFKIFY